MFYRLWLAAHVHPVKYLPDWVPGAGFLVDARSWRQELDHLARKPVRVVKELLVRAGGQVLSQCPDMRQSSGAMDACYVAQHLEAGADEEDVTWSATSLFTGGADTTVSSIVSFFLAMCKYPKVKQLAQDEIDSVLRREGVASPTLAQRHMMPYVNACVAELLRWQPAIPLG